MYNFSNINLFDDYTGGGKENNLYPNLDSALIINDERPLDSLFRKTVNPDSTSMESLNTSYILNSNEDEDENNKRKKRETTANETVAENTGNTSETKTENTSSNTLQNTSNVSLDTNKNTLNDDSLNAINQNDFKTNNTTTNTGNNTILIIIVVVIFLIILIIIFWYVFKAKKNNNTRSIFENMNNNIIGLGGAGLSAPISSKKTIIS